MNGKELLDAYPKATQLIKRWFLNKMREYMKTSEEVPDDFKKYMEERGIASPILISMMDKNPSFLFKTFDEMGIYIETPLVIEPNKVRFTWDIFVNGIYPFGTTKYDTRIESESAAIEAAMSYIDKHFDELNNETNDAVITEDVK